MPTQKNIESIIEGIRRKDSCSKDSSYLVYSNGTSNTGSMDVVGLLG